MIPTHPGFTLYRRAWDAHPRHQELAARQAQGGWAVVRRVEADGWSELWQLAVDPRETREPIRVCVYPPRAVERPMADAAARDAEQHTDGRC